MAKILAIGDLHFKASNLVEGNELVCKIIEKVAEIKEIDAIVLLGDLLDNHATVHSQAFNLVYKLLDALKEYKVFVLVGNHDYINNSQFLTTQHPFNVFKGWGENIVIVDDYITWIKDDQKFVFLPYVPTGRFQEALKTKEPLELSKIECIFAHQEFKGAIFGDKGDEWDYETQVISGHIHTQVNLKQLNCEGMGAVFYLGSPVQHCFAETPDKSILYMDTLNKPNWTFHKLDLPQKHTIEMELSDIDSLVLPERATVRLRLKCSCSSWAIFKKSKKYKELVDAKVKVQPLAIDDEVQLKKMARNRTTYIQSLKTYAESSGGYVQEAFTQVMEGLAA
jgi:DNA repair exonuclease SbcCD nuclease subunit